MTLSTRLVQFLYDRQSEGLPANVIEKAKLHVCDTVGIAYAANGGIPVSDHVLQALAVGAGGGDCSIIGSNEKLPPALAAFGNSALMHALDYDDIHDTARVHPTPVTLAAALAAAQLTEGQGRNLWEAVALSNELVCRLGLACSPRGSGPASHWFLSQLFGYLGGALAASIVLGLSQETAVSALGLAYMQASGGKESGLGVGSNARSIYPAFAAMGGVHAALLARAGVAGPPASLDGRAGMFRIFLGDGPDDRQIEQLLDPADWVWMQTEPKPWPSCRLSHAYIAAALNVRSGLPQSPIRRVVVSVNPSAANLCRPLEGRRQPQTLQDAKFSVPFITAFTLVHGTVTLNNLRPESIRDAAVLDLASRVDVLENLPDNPGQPPAEVMVETDVGTFNSGTGIVNSMSAEQIRAKFLDCLDFAGLAAAAPGLWKALLQLDESGVAPIFSLRRDGRFGAAAA